MKIGTISTQQRDIIDAVMLKRDLSLLNPRTVAELAQRLPECLAHPSELAFGPIFWTQIGLPAQVVNIDKIRRGYFMGMITVDQE